MMCSVCCNYNMFLSSSMTYHQVCSKSNTTDVTSGAGTTYLSWAPEFIPGFLVVFVLLDLQFSALCFVDRCLYLFYLFVIVLSVLRFTDSVYPFVILDLPILFTSLLSQIYRFCLPLCYLRFTDQVYPFVILDLPILFTPVLSQIQRFCLPLCYLRYSDSVHPFVILDLPILFTPLLSQIYRFSLPLISRNLWYFPHKYS